MDFSELGATLTEIPQDKAETIEGIPLSGASIVELQIDGQDTKKLALLAEGFIVFDELLKSAHSSGTFLIFTSISGIADSGGWEKVAVTHAAGQTAWNINRDCNTATFTFSTSKYRDTLKQLDKEVQSALARGLSIEPRDIIFPE